MIENLGDAQRFLTRYWQKKPLLARGALAQLGAALDRTRMVALACRDDVESRLVLRTRNQWHVQQGPFRKRDFAQLPARNWTLLINGLENVICAARELQRMFSFIPYARHDDVMASYAAPGGSVGPHFDSYDVMLVQGIGARRWSISAQRDLALIEGAPLKLLRRFKPQRAWKVQCGDLLYLPPRYAHNGVAVTECITWSVGFRAPSRQEMAERFLDFVRDNLALSGNYRDPDIKSQRHPSMIPRYMLRQVRGMVASIRWNKSDVEQALGEYLTEPRANIVFAPAAGITRQRFDAIAAANGVRLSAPSRMLIGNTRVYINGESCALEDAHRDTLLQLGDERLLPPRTRIDARLRELLYRWYLAGYIDTAGQKMR
jgi:50S ribosomal protein L16 3-hydroxylase